MSDLLIRVTRPVARAWGRACYRLEFEGVENVPTTGPVIFTPNHVTYLDPIWISVPVQRRIYYMAWDAVFRIPVFASILRVFGAFPVRIEGHDKSAMREARCHLAAGRALMVFPEGGRTTTGKLMPFKAGAYRLALFAGAPIVPVTIDGAHEIWPVDALLPRPFGRVRITFHPPIPVAAAEGCDMADLRHRARKLADAARAAVASALPPSRVGPAHATPAHEEARRPQ
jgi:1-acyl-sn-glycerol-3-phosphate acyltransferase